MVMQPEEREFCTAQGTAVKQVKPNAGNVLSALSGIVLLLLVSTTFVPVVTIFQIVFHT